MVLLVGSGWSGLAPLPGRIRLVEWLTFLDAPTFLLLLFALFTPPISQAETIYLKCEYTASRKLDARVDGILKDEVVPIPVEGNTISGVNLSCLISMTAKAL